jgi:hypothetical protein
VTGCHASACLPASLPACLITQPYACLGKLDKVVDTLKLISATGFKVVRIWAFSNGPGSDCLHKTPGVPHRT